MGGNLARCCRNEDRLLEEDPKKRNGSYQLKRNTATSDRASNKSIADHYNQNAGHSLIRVFGQAKEIEPPLNQKSQPVQSVQVSISPSKSTFSPLLFDFTKGLSGNSLSEQKPSSLRKGSGSSHCFDESTLIEQIQEFFYESGYRQSDQLSQLTASTLTSMRESRDISNSSQLAYECCYCDSSTIKTGEELNLSIYLRKDQRDNQRHYSSIVEGLFTEISSIDDFLIASEFKLAFEVSQDLIESSKIIYQQIISEGLQMQVIYVVFKQMHHSKQRDLIYTKIVKRIDKNTCLVSAHSVSLQAAASETDTEQISQINNAQLGFETLLGSIPARKKKSVRITQQQQQRKKSSDRDTKYERALLGMSGMKITFNENRNSVFLQELCNLDMKNDSQHSVQKDAILLESKLRYQQLSKAIITNNEQKSLANKEFLTSIESDNYSSIDQSDSDN